MKTVQDFIEVVENHIVLLPTNHFLTWFHSNNPQPDFETVTRLWVSLWKFMGPFVPLYEEHGDSLRYSVAHHHYRFLKSHGNRLKTTTRELVQELRGFGGAAEYKEYSEEYARVIKLISDANRTYAITKVITGRLLKKMQRDGQHVNVFLRQPITATVFIAPEYDDSPDDGVPRPIIPVKPPRVPRDPRPPSEMAVGDKDSMALRRALRKERAPFYDVLGIAASMQSLSAKQDWNDDGLDFSVGDYPNYSPPEGIPDIDPPDPDEGLDLPFDIEVGTERGLIDVPIGEDFGIIIGGGLDPPTIELTAYAGVDWDQAIVDALDDVWGAVQDAFDCY